jgi:hypothetical protein
MGGFMEPETIENITRAKALITSVIMTTLPGNDYEIDVHGVLVDVYHKLNTIKMDKLGQLPLPEKKPEGNQSTFDDLSENTNTSQESLVECPTCKGAKTVTVGDGEPGICPTCKGEGKVKEIDKPILQQTENPVIVEASSAGDITTAAAADISTAAAAIAPVHLEKEFIDNILAINSVQSLAEKPPRVLGMFAVDDLFPGKNFVCTGTVWGQEEKDIAALAYEAIEAEKYTGVPRTMATADENSFAGVKFTYKEKDYVFIGTEYQFAKFVPETKPVKRPRKSGRKSNTEKKASQQAIVDNKSE